MRPSRTMIFALFLVLCCLPFQADAKWWIFGTSEDEVETSYLYLNRVAFNETGTRVTLYRDMLPSGLITIQGKGIAGRNRIASVRISLDGKESWIDAKLSESGAFEYSFRPDFGRTYKLFVEVTDTTGKTNIIDATYKEITISDANIQAVVRDAMDRLIDAYQRENPGQFMALVADDFTADKTILDRAIRKDFLTFDNIYLRYTLNNVSSDAVGRVFTVLSFNRQVTSTRTGQTLTDRGTTQFTFKVGDRGLRLWDMKIPLIFGLSDASNVATGVTNVGTNDPILIVDAKGNTSLVPFPQAVQKIQSGSTSESGQGSLTTTCTALGCVNQGFAFQGAILSNPTIGTDDISMNQQMLFLRNGTQQLPLGSRSIDSVTSVPTGGYQPVPEIFLGTNIGNTFALRLVSGKYALIQIVNFSATAPGPTQVFRVTFRYKYQPDGTPNF
jgi:hypothetical protein